MKKQDKYNETMHYISIGGMFLVAGISFAFGHWVAMAFAIGIIILFSPIVRRWKE